MNRGIYLDMRNPPLWRRDWSRRYGFSLELCEEAERLGLHSVWLSEHHRFEDGYLPQPLTFAAAVAARTTRLRIGTAVLLAPLHRAAHVAEEARSWTSCPSGVSTSGSAPVTACPSTSCTASTPPAGTTSPTGWPATYLDRGGGLGNILISRERRAVPDVT